MSTNTSVSSFPDVMQTDPVSPEPTVQLGDTSADSTPQEPKETPAVPESILDTGSRQDTDIVDATHDVAVLSEVRDSLYEISNGVNELSTTVLDLLGLSESEGDSLEDYATDIKHSPRFLWSRMKSNARRRRRDRLKAEIDAAAQDAIEASDELTNKRLEIIPGVRECNSLWQFSSPTEGDSNKAYCVDILTGVDPLDKDNAHLNETLTTGKAAMIEPGRPDHVLEQEEERSSEQIEKKWIRTIRINSRVVLTTLGKLHRMPGGPAFGVYPVEFPRPFQLLVSLHEKVKDHLASMKSKDIDCSDFSEAINTPAADLDSMRVNGRNGPVLDLADNENAVDELNCFVDLMESQIMPDSRRYRVPSSALPHTIRYEDLWYLFKPGDLVYISPDTSARSQPRSSVFAQSIFRVIQTRLTTTSCHRPIGLDAEKWRTWSLVTHFIDHDGTSYAPIDFVITIVPFQGKKKVTELNVYPVSYLEDETIMAQAISDGQNYVNLIERRSGFYSGWTQVVSPFGATVRTASPGETLSSPEHIESEILVDFQETFNAFPEWKLRCYQWLPSDPPSWVPASLVKTNGHGMPPPPGQHYDGFNLRTRFPWQKMEMDPTEINEALEFLREDELGQFKPDTRDTPTGKFLALLPRRLFAYAVLERRFVPLDPRFVRNSDLDVHEKAFEKLEINKEYKRLILALVKSHFDKVETERRTNVEIGTQDLIRGKGKGIVILLHGVPGVGKTATAEAVALKWKKPLFPITCGDLGYTAESLEKSLNEIFRLAHHWGCILLLDEADVFITQRERHDLKRNALVSAFLRVLEYYNGIMFLTTNRAGVLDESVKSRVHLSLHYDHLTEHQTVAIFNQHIQRLKEIERQRNPDPDDRILVRQKQILDFAKDHYNRRGNNQGSGPNLGRWNGRQIKNAFLIASSLAHYDSEEEDDDGDLGEREEPRRKKQKQLGRSQFDLVARSTLLYDQYRQSVHSGKTDDHVAFEREERERPSHARSPTPARFKSGGMGLD